MALTGHVVAASVIVPHLSRCLSTPMRPTTFPAGTASTRTFLAPRSATTRWTVAVYDLALGPDDLLSSPSAVAVPLALAGRTSTLSPGRTVPEYTRPHAMKPLDFLPIGTSLLTYTTSGPSASQAAMAVAALSSLGPVYKGTPR